MKIINIESENDWRTYLPILLENSENKVLVRTNYRAKKLKNFGYHERQLCTIHSSKGLEYPTVFLDLTEGWSSEGIDSIDLEEERRVLYVGLSRAISALWIFGKQNGTKESLETIFFQYFTKY